MVVFQPFFYERALPPPSVSEARPTPSPAPVLSSTGDPAQDVQSQGKCCSSVLYSGARFPVGLANPVRWVLRSRAAQR